LVVEHVSITTRPGTVKTIMCHLAYAEHRLLKQTYVILNEDYHIQRLKER